jgi:flagellar hook assembly protein FlgD
MDAGMPVTSVENYSNSQAPEQFALGEKVRSLVNTRQEAGSYDITWNGRNELGQLMPSGIYFYRLNAGSQILMKKMTLLK